MNESGPWVFRISLMTPKAPEPESGLRSAIGSASAGTPKRLVTGSRKPIKRSRAPEARSIATATRIRTRKGTMRSATSRPSRAPSTADSYTRTRPATPTSSRNAIRAGTSQVERTLRATSPGDAVARLRAACRANARVKAAPKPQIRTRAPRVALTSDRGPGSTGSSVARGLWGSDVGRVANASNRYLGRRRSAKWAAIAVAHDAKVAKSVGTQIDAGAIEPAPARTVKVPRGSR